MAKLSEQFEKAAQDVTKLAKKPGNDVLLKLYSLFKQAKEGDCTGSRPGFLDIAGRAKFDAWKALAGTSSEEAMKSYVALVESLKNKG